MKGRKPFKRPIYSDFNTAIFDYKLITPQDNSITQDDILANSGISREQYNILKELVLEMNETTMRKNDTSYLYKLIKILLSSSDEQMMTIREETAILARANNISILQQLMSDATTTISYPNEIAADLETINIISQYIANLSQNIYNFAKERFTTTPENIDSILKYPTSILLFEICTKILSIGINPIAIILSSAGDYLNNDQLRIATQDIADEDWDGILTNLQSGHFTGISPRAFEIMIYIMRGNKERLADSLPQEQKEGNLAQYISGILETAVKFDRHQIIKYLLEEYFEVINSYHPNLVYSTFSAVIRGNLAVCLEFIKPSIWENYSEHEQAKIVKFIILRSGSQTTKILLNELYADRSLTLGLYQELLEHVKEDDYAKVNRAISPFIAKKIADAWFHYEYDYQVGTIHSLINLSRAEEENAILKYLHGDGLLSFAIYRDVLDQSDTPERKAKVEKLFAPYIEVLTQERDDTITGEGYSLDEYAAAFKSLNLETKRIFIQDETKKTQHIIDDTSLKEEEKISAIKIIVDKIDLLLSKKAIDSSETTPLRSKVADFFASTLSNEIALVSKKIEPKPKKKVTKSISITKQKDSEAEKPTDKVSQYNSGAPEYPDEDSQGEWLVAGSKEKATQATKSKVKPVIKAEVKTLKKINTDDFPPLPTTTIKSKAQEIQIEHQEAPQQNTATVILPKQMNEEEIPVLNFMAEATASDRKESVTETKTTSLPEYLAPPVVAYGGSVYYSVPSVQVACNAFYLDQFGNQINFYMDPLGNCLDQFGNQFAMPVYYTYMTGYYGGGNYTGGGSGGAVKSSSTKKHSAKNYGKKKHIDTLAEETQKDPDGLITISIKNKDEVIISLTTLTKDKIISIEAKQYQESIEAIKKRMEDYKPHVKLDHLHQFEQKLQNYTYVSISQDNNILPKSPFFDTSIKFAGAEHVNAEEIYM